MYTRETYRLRKSAEKQTAEHTKLLEQAQRQNEVTMRLVSEASRQNEVYAKVWIEAQRQNELAVMPLLAILVDSPKKKCDARSTILWRCGFSPRFAERWKWPRI